MKNHRKLVTASIAAALLSSMGYSANFRVIGSNPGSSPSGQSEPLESPYSEIDLGPGIPQAVNNKGQVLINNMIWDWGVWNTLPGTASYPNVTPSFINNNGESVSLAVDSDASNSPSTYDYVFWASDFSPIDKTVPGGSASSASLSFLDDLGRSFFVREKEGDPSIPPHVILYTSTYLGSNVISSQSSNMSGIDGTHIVPYKANSLGDYFGTKSIDGGVSFLVKKVGPGTRSLDYTPSDIGGDGTIIGLTDDGGNKLVIDGYVKRVEPNYANFGLTPGDPIFSGADSATMDRWIVWEGMVLERLPKSNGYAPSSYQKVLLPVGFIPSDVSDNGLIVGYKSVEGVDTGYLLVNMEIIPAVGMCGVVGDVVSSIKGRSGESHFVSPKKSLTIPNDYVVLEVKGISQNLFLKYFEWDTSIGEAVPGKPLMWRVSRNTASKNKVKIKLKASGEVVATMNVWIVWWEFTTIKGFPAMEYNGFSIADVTFDSRAKPVPSEIMEITTADVPDMTGPNITPAPNEDQIHGTDGAIVGGPDWKWDITQAWRERDLVPTLTAADLGWNPNGTLYNSLPNPNVIQNTSINTAVDGWPIEILEGNDHDPSSIRNPYTALNNELVLIDNPTVGAKDTSGSLGDVFESRLQFRIFVRAEINKKWYIVSNKTPWRFHAGLVKVSESFLGEDINFDGDTLDQPWIKDGDPGLISDETLSGW